MALPATDNFNRAAPIGSNWTAGLGTITIVSNQFRASAAGDSFAFWNADTFGNNQYSKFTTIAASGGVTWVGAVVRASGTSCYLAFTDFASLEIGKYVSGSYTSLASNATTFANGNTLELQVSGTALTALKNGASVLTASDSSLSSGSAGVYSYGNGDGDDWEGGNLAGASITLVQLERLARGQFRGMH